MLKAVTLTGCMLIAAAGLSMLLPVPRDNLPRAASGGPIPIPAPVSAVMLSSLKDVIEKTCAGSAERVEVLTPGKSVLVRLWVRDPSLGGDLITEILNLPQCRPFMEQMSFEVIVIGPTPQVNGEW